MSTSNAAVPSPEETARAEQGSTADKVRVQTRYGSIEFERTRIVTLAQGVLGFPGKLEYALTDLPEKRFGQFNLLQSVTDPEVSFPVLSLEFLPGLIEEADVGTALQTLGIASENAVVFIIATARKDDARVTISVNLRAPIFLDTTSRTSRQFVLPISTYPIRHVLK